MTPEELEKEVLTLKDKLSFWRGAFVVGAVLILGWLSIQSFVQIPQKVENLFAEKAGKDIEAKIEKINAASDDLDGYLVTLLNGRRIYLEVAGGGGFQPNNKFIGFRPAPRVEPNYEHARVEVGGGGPNEVLTIRLAK